MIYTSAVFHGTARVTITGLLTVSFFKKAAVDHAAQVIHSAEKVTIVTIGLAAADLCLSTAILLLASDRTARKLLSGDFNQPKDKSPSLYSDNMPETSTPPTSPSTDFTDYSAPLTGTTPVPRQKRFSVESHTTLVADDDDDDPSDLKQSFGDESEDGNLLHGTKHATHRVDNSDSQLILTDGHWTTTANPDFPLPASLTTTTTRTSLFLTGSTPTQSISPPPKPPDTERILNRRQQQHRARLRAARARSYIGK
ncbi:hypothetical protein DEU56DRAFT_789327 [Suillus clintonianus]|uniref:uncharacterized protein n=1 Tax=Suillus clintonianus TaxID=1904413 RepID=UPI001B86BEA5|nr:uncharacterized protein DEU56DRAFT_789327 [Suillus clintonianus]KAG2145192.1 hypothetical protein DEU56DRAFT_789327 [Suillus clintonianus]